MDGFQQHPASRKLQKRNLENLFLRIYCYIIRLEKNGFMMKLLDQKKDESQLRFSLSGSKTDIRDFINFLSIRNSF